MWPQPPYSRPTEPPRIQILRCSAVLQQLNIGQDFSVSLYNLQFISGTFNNIVSSRETFRELSLLYL